MPKSETTFSYNFQKEINTFGQNPFSRNKKSVSFSDNYGVNAEQQAKFETILKEFDVKTIR